MKVLTVNCTYKIYSTGKIIKDIENVLMPLGCSFVHCYEFGDKAEDKNAYRLSGYIEYRIYYVLAHITGLQYGGGFLSNIRLKNIIKREKPDIVHIHCPNAFSVDLYGLLNYLKKNDIRTVITNHAEYFFTGNCAHADECKGYLSGCKSCVHFKEASNSLIFNRTAAAWKRMRQAFKGFTKICMVAVSPWAEDRLNQSVICGHLPSCSIFNGIDTENIFYPRKQSGQEKFGVTDQQPIFLCVTSHFSDSDSDMKGGKYLIKLAENLQRLNIDCKFVVAGPYELEHEYRHLKNLVLLGKIDDQNRLAELYSMADLTILTSRRETFGLTCVESMCCGTPVVGFVNGGTESIALKKFSVFVEYGNLEKLQEIVIEWSDRKKKVFPELAEEAREAYSKEKMALNYWELYKKMMTL